MRAAALKLPLSATATETYRCLKKSVTKACQQTLTKVASSSIQMSAPTVFEAPQSHRWRILLILSALMAFASISTDLYLPAMPEMGNSLHANDGRIELTVSGFLVGFSLGQLVWGVVSDRYGRRLSITLGPILFVIGSAGCAMSPTAEVMISGGWFKPLAPAPMWFWHASALH